MSQHASADRSGSGGAAAVGQRSSRPVERGPRVEGLGHRNAVRRDGEHEQGAGAVTDQTGQAVECVVIMMVIYLAISLLTSLLMNWFNAKMALVER